MKIASGHLLHVLDTAKVLLQLIPLLLECDNFLLGQHIESSVLSHLLDCSQAGNTALDGLEVGQHTAEPSLVYIVHTAALCLGLDSILCLLLGTNKQDGAAVLLRSRK